MPLLDSTALLKEYNASKTKLLAEAFVKHVIPLIDAASLQEAFLQQIKTSSKPELPIFAYKTTEITVDGKTIAEDSLTGQKVSTAAYEFCDKLPCGTPVGKAISGWAACELLGMVLGPNIYVGKRFMCSNEDHPQWLGYTSEIVAQFQEKPVKRSATGLAWWPEAFLKELITGTGPFPQFERSSENLLDALLATDASPQQELDSSEGVVWTRDADGIMRCPGGGMDLRDPRTNALWQCGLANDAPKDQTVPGGARRFFSIQRDRRAALSLRRPDPILDFKHNSRSTADTVSAMGPPPPLERVNTCVGDEPTYSTKPRDCGDDAEVFSLERGPVFSEAWYTSTSCLKYYVRPEFVAENLEQLEQMVAEKHAARSSAKDDGGKVIPNNSKSKNPPILNLKHYSGGARNLFSIPPSLLTWKSHLGTTQQPATSADTQDEGGCSIPRSTAGTVENFPYSPAPGAIELASGTYLDERPDEECTYCGKMESDCGGDHGDDMRYDQQLSRSRSSPY